MRDDIILKLQRITEGNDKITWEYFPAVYDGFVEAEELSLAEDKMLQLVASAVLTATDDKLISTASSDKVSEYEEQLGLSAGSMTLEQRRHQVIDFINRSRVINAEDLRAIVRTLDGGETNDIEVNSRRLLLRIKKVANAESEDDMSDLVNAWHVVQPVIPQNLNVELRTTAKLEKNLSAVYCSTSWLNSNIGEVERHVVITGTYGLMTDNGDENVQGAVYGDEIGRPTALYTNTLEENEPGTYGEIETAVEATAYLRSSAYQHLNKNVTANSTNFLYDAGADVSLYVDGAKTYTLISAYTNGGASVDITGSSLTLIESSGQYSLRLIWGQTAAQVCYIEYSIQ